MAIANIDSGRQDVLVAVQAFDYSEMVDATAVPAVNVPPGAIVVGGQLVITTAFNSATSDTIAVGDGTNTYLAATSVAATGATALSGGLPYSVSDTVDLTWDGTGAVPSAGAGYLVLEYVIDGRACEVQD